MTIVWSVAYTAEALKALSRMDRIVAQRMRSKILALARDPMESNNNIKKLAGVDGFRLRIGDWRAVYTLRRETLTVIVVRVAHRSEVYR
jgi:mRNA interferase RelE/StbE